MTRLLYLEDDEPTRKSLQRLLECRGVEIEAHGTSEGAAHYLAAACANIALLDIRLPGEFGDVFARKLQARHPGIQIIFLTAEESIGHLKEKVPGCLVLRKPVDLDVLLRLICDHADCPHNHALCPYQCRHRREPGLVAS